MDPRTYVTLEQSLARKLIRGWRSVGGGVCAAIGEAIEAGDFDRARVLVSGLSLATVGSDNEEYIHYLLQACVVFGAKTVSDTTGVLLSGDTQSFLKTATSTFLLYLQHGGSTALQAEVLQLIATAEEGTVVRKFNPYHDADGKFTDKPHASEPSDVVKKAIKAYTAQGGAFSSKLSVTEGQRKEMEEWLGRGITGEGKSLFQGDSFSEKEFDDIFQKMTTPGSEISLRSPSFSEDAVRTAGYKGGQYPVRFELVGGLKGRDIQEVSIYPEEKEHLAAPGGKFRVVSAEYKSAGGKWFIQIKQVDLVQKADTPRKARPFVSFADQTKKFGEDKLMLVSSLHSSRLAVWGFTAEAETVGVSKYKLNATLDGRTSNFCRWINGMEFEVVDARSKVTEVLSAQDPEDLKTLQPWPNQSKASMEEIQGLSTEQLVSRGYHIPPFHPGCRTLLALVSQVNRLQKPTQPAPHPVIKEPTTEASFKQLGVDLTPAQLAHWNAYVGVSPVDWLAKLAGVSPTKALEGVFGKNAIKIAKDGDIVTLVKGVSGGTKFSVGTILDPFTGRMYLSQADLVVGDAVAEHNFLKQVLAATIDTSLSVGATTVVVSVGQYAYYYGKLGFMPTAAQWQEIRLELMEKLTEGELSKVLPSLNSDQQSLLLNLLSNQHEGALGALVDLPWAYRGTPIGQILLDGVSGSFELDLSTTESISHIKGYLQ